MFIKLLISLALVGSALVGDTLVEGVQDALPKALLDNATHGVIGALTWSIISLQEKQHFLTRDTLIQIAVCSFLSSAIDLDHFVAAQSFKLKDVHLLRRRPLLHCSTLAAGIAGCVIFLSHLRGWQRLHTFGWAALAAFVTHHTRDAARRGFWCWPFGSSSPLPYWTYIFLTAIIPYPIFYMYDLSKDKLFSHNDAILDKNYFIV